MTIPLAPVLGLAAGLARPITLAMGGNIETAIQVATRNYTGYDTVAKKFDIMQLANGVLPLVIGLLVHKFVGGAPLNANRLLGRAKVPVIRI